MKYLKRYTNAEQAVWREMGGAYGCWMKDKSGLKHYGYGELRETAMLRAQYAVSIRGKEANSLDAVVQ